MDNLDELVGRRPDHEALAEDTLSLAGDTYFQNRRARLERKLRLNHNETRSKMERVRKLSEISKRYTRPISFRNLLIKASLPMYFLEPTIPLKMPYHHYAFEWAEDRYLMGKDYSIRFWD